MLNREQINLLKNEGNGAIASLLNQYSDSASISFILENLGHLPKDFDGSFLPILLKSKSTKVRLWAVKTLGKMKSNEFIKLLGEIALKDVDSIVRREAVSSIGRLRSTEGKSYLLKILTDSDPKIICQAIRGLLVFKGESEVDKHLSVLIDHDNEMVRTIIYKEYFSVCNKNKMQLHTESYDYLKNVIVNADTISTMKLLQDESIHLTFTSPPYYNARDYSIYPSYKHYLEFLSEVFKEVHRVTKEGRFLILNTSPIIIPRISRSHSSKRYPIPFDIHPYLMNSGWEFIDDIIWVKPEASVKNRIGGFMQHRKPLAYKPNSVTEYLMVYRKSTEKLLDWNLKQYNWNTIKESRVEEGYESTNIWKIDPCFNKVHSAVFPVELCKRVIQYYSFKGDLVFDPFAGSGTVGRTAKNLDRYFFLTEQNPTYFNYMKTKRVESVFEKFPTHFLDLEQFRQTIS